MRHLAFIFSLKTKIANKYMICEWRYSPVNVVKEISCKVTPGCKIVLIFIFSSPIPFEGQPLGHLERFSRQTGGLLCSIKSPKELILFLLILIHSRGIFPLDRLASVLKNWWLLLMICTWAGHIYNQSSPTCTTVKIKVTKSKLLVQKQLFAIQKRTYNFSWLVSGNPYHTSPAKSLK